MNYKTIILIIIITLIIYFLIKNTKISEKFTLYNSYGAIEFVDKNTSERLYTFPPPPNNFDNYVTDNNIDVTVIKIEQGIKGKPGNDATLPEPPLCNNVIDGIEKIKPKSGNIINLPDINLNNQTINITNNLCIGNTDEKNCINYNKLNSLSTSNSILRNNIDSKRKGIDTLESNIDVCNNRKEQIKYTSNQMIHEIGYVSNEDCDAEYIEREKLLNTLYYDKINGPSYEFLPDDEKNKIKQRNDITICDISIDELERENYYLKQNKNIDCSDVDIKYKLSLDNIFKNKFNKVEESQNFKDNYIKTSDLTPDKLNINTKQIKGDDKYINKFNIDNNNYRYVNPDKVNQQIKNLSDNINLVNDDVYNTAYDIITESSNWKRKIDTTNVTEDVYYYDQNDVFDKLKECKYYKNKYLTSNYIIEDITNWQDHYCSKLNDNCIKIGHINDDNKKYMKKYSDDSRLFNYYENKLTDVESNTAIRDDKCLSNCSSDLKNKSEISLDGDNYITNDKNSIAVYNNTKIPDYTTYYDKLSEEELNTLKFDNWHDKESSWNNKLLTNEKKEEISSDNKKLIEEKIGTKEIYHKDDKPFIKENKLEYLNKYNEISTSKQYMIFDDYESYKSDPVYTKSNNKQYVFIKENDIGNDYKYLHYDTNNNVNIDSKNEELQKLNIAAKVGDNYELYIWNELLNSNVKLTENDMKRFKEEQENYNNSKSCDEGMFYNSRTQECEEKKCKCMFGENYAANGINCPNNGDEKCVYKCPNGTPKIYNDRLKSFSEINRCSSCNSGFTKHTRSYNSYTGKKTKDICKEDEYQACQCNNGYAFGKGFFGLTNLDQYYSCTTEEPNKCSSCKFGYKKEGNKCSWSLPW